MLKCEYCKLAAGTSSIDSDCAGDSCKHSQAAAVQEKTRPLGIIQEKLMLNPGLPVAM